MTFKLPHHENQNQRINNDFWFCILGIQGIVWILEFMVELLTSCIPKHRKSKMKYTDFKIIDIAYCTT